MKLSMSLSRGAVSFLYACHSCVAAFDADCETFAPDTLADETDVAPNGLRGIALGAILSHRDANKLQLVGDVEVAALPTCSLPAALAGSPAR
jgi:hypothetical protein